MRWRASGPSGPTPIRLIRSSARPRSSGSAPGAARRVASSTTCSSSETSQGKRERVRGGGVEPLDVVDRDGEGSLVGCGSEHGERGGAHGPRVHRSGTRSHAQQRHVKRVALRRWNIRADLVDHGSEQVTERGVRQTGLGRDRSRGEHSQTVLLGLGDARQP